MDYNLSGNLQKGYFYACPRCNNLVYSLAPLTIQCCEQPLQALVPQPAAEEHAFHIERVEGEFFVSLSHEMTKSHSIQFLAYVRPHRMDLVKLYPEGPAESRFAYGGRGMLYAYCQVHGLQEMPLIPQKITKALP